MSSTQTASAPQAQNVVPYQDALLTTAERVSDLLGRMSVEEKVGQMLHW